MLAVCHQTLRNWWTGSLKHHCLIGIKLLNVLQKTQKFHNIRVLPEKLHLHTMSWTSRSQSLVIWNVANWTARCTAPYVGCHSRTCQHWRHTRHLIVYHQPTKRTQRLWRRRNYFSMYAVTADVCSRMHRRLRHTLWHTQENVEFLVVLLDATSILHNTVLAVFMSGPILMRSHICVLSVVVVSSMQLVFICTWASTRDTSHTSVTVARWHFVVRVICKRIRVFTGQNDHIRAICARKDLRRRGRWAAIFWHCIAMRFHGIVVSAIRDLRPLVTFVYT